LDGRQYGGRTGEVLGRDGGKGLFISEAVEDDVFQDDEHPAIEGRAFSVTFGVLEGAADSLLNRVLCRFGGVECGLGIAEEAGVLCGDSVV